MNSTTKSLTHFSRRLISGSAAVIIALVTTMPAQAAYPMQNKPSVPPPARVHVRTSAPPPAPPYRLKFSADPSDAEIKMARVFLEPLIPLTGQPTAGENKALANALLSFKSKKDPDDVSDLTKFLVDYPKSRWSASLECNLAGTRFATGYVSEALKYWTSAWEQAKDEKGIAQRAIADEALAQIVVMNARLGRSGEVEQYLALANGRSLTGSVEERVNAAKLSLAKMRAMPEESFRCGPLALTTLFSLNKKHLESNRLFATAHSTLAGTSLAQLADWAVHGGLLYTPAKRSPGAKIITPCIMHWKTDHYCAITDEFGGRYRTQDPTFGLGGSSMISAKAIDAESDGYFLIPAGTLPAGWRAVTKEEASSVWGKGQDPSTGIIDFIDMTLDTPICIPCLVNLIASSILEAAPPAVPDGNGSKSNQSSTPMAQVGIWNMSAMPNVFDTPLTYVPPLGPAIDFRVNYNFNEANMPTTFAFANLGPDWTLNWISYLTTDGSGDVTIRVSGGGSEYYANHGNVQSPLYYHDRLSQALLQQPGTNQFTRTLRDGSVQYFDLPDGTGRIFMSHAADPQGNTVSLTYDANFRLTAVTDAYGQVSTLTYASPTSNVITQITDPFGRSATFNYDSTYTYLLSITDYMGITSILSYQPGSSFISAVATPYGTTTLQQYIPPNGPDFGAMGLKVTLPDGSISQLETWPFIQASFYWNPEAMQQYPNDPATESPTYTNNAGFPQHAICTKWLGETSGAVIAMPLFVQPPVNPQGNQDDQIWFGYWEMDQGDVPARYDSYWNSVFGSADRPMYIVRTAPNTTAVNSQKANFPPIPLTSALQQWQFDYGSSNNPSQNSFGVPLTMTDPLNRTFNFTYNNSNVNNIDLIKVQQNATGEVLGQWSYNNQHEPLTSTDASGQSTTCTYNDQGQPLTVTNANGNTSTSTYLSQPAIIASPYTLPKTGDSKTFQIIIINSGLPGGSVTKSYAMTSTDTLGTIASTLASQINSDSNLRSNNITATAIPYYPVIPGGDVQAGGLYLTSLSPNPTTFSPSVTTGTGSETFSNASNMGGLMARVTGPLSANEKATFTYDGYNRVYTATDSEGYTLTYSYDVADRPTQVTYPDGTNEQVVYSNLDAIMFKNRLGNWTQDSYNSMDRLAYEIDPLGRKTQYSWCACGALMSLTDPNGNVTSWTRDLQGRATKKAFQDGSFYTYAYDGMGRLQTRSDAITPNPQVATYG